MMAAFTGGTDRVKVQRAMAVVLGCALVVLVLLAYPVSAGAAESSPPPRSPDSGQVWRSPRDNKEMVWVPAGGFVMGSQGGEPDADGDEDPQRLVYVDGFWMDKCEVTVGEYRRFCGETGREMPEAPTWGWKDDHPVALVSWHDAAAYASWAGKRLPTEAEWEKAARGTDGRKYPWGNSKSGTGGDNRARVWKGMGNDFEYAAPVGSFPSGASPYGCLDMAGNVWEWCADWYDRDYYDEAPTRNPAGPGSGTARVFRGGSWLETAGLVGCDNRGSTSPSDRAANGGFRCARDAE